MKIYISNFYQIRYFTPDMIPLSTANFDPLWYHNFRKDQKVTFKNDNDVVCGLRIDLLRAKNNNCHGMPCVENPSTCKFLTMYEEQLNKIGFDKFMEVMSELEDNLKSKLKIDPEKELTFVLIVYEAKNNLCSERTVLKKWFKKNGKNLKEWEHEK